MLLQSYVRVDYRELLELALVCLNDSPSAKFRRPGALHHARWMAKAIYGLKMYLFRDQFPIDSNQLQRFVLFVVQVYIKAWFEAPIATNAPMSDLELMRCLKKYRDKELSQSTYQKFEKHLWYLSELNISLSFFDERVSVELKRKMVQNLKKKSSGKNKRRVKKFSLKTGLEDHVTENSIQFFEILRLDCGFLFEEDPSNWSNRDDYLAARSRCRDLCVINDPAERALGVAGDFNEFGPKSDKEKHHVVMVVANNRKNQNNAKKSSVFNYLTR